MMKRLLALFLALVMVCTASACGSVPPVDTPVAEGNVAPVEEENDEKDTVQEVLPQFQEITVEDNEYCTIKITGIDPEDMFGYGVKVYLENKSPDTTYMFSVDNASVNGVAADPFFAAEVAPGKKANETITFTDPAPEGEDIGAYTDILLNFRVYDSNDWMADAVAETGTHVYPLGEEKASAYVREQKASDVVLAETDEITVLATGCRVDDVWGYTVDLYIVNKAGNSVMVSTDEVSVNGFMVDPFYACEVAEQTCAFSGISWNETDFTDNGITDVEEIEMILKVYDANDWSAAYFEETVTLIP